MFCLYFNLLVFFKSLNCNLGKKNTPKILDILLSVNYVTFLKNVINLIEKTSYARKLVSLFTTFIIAFIKILLSSVIFQSQFVR